MGERLVLHNGRESYRMSDMLGSRLAANRRRGTDSEWPGKTSARVQCEDLSLQQLAHLRLDPIRAVRPIINPAVDPYPAQPRYAKASVTIKPMAEATTPRLTAMVKSAG